MKVRTGIFAEAQKGFSECRRSVNLFVLEGKIIFS
jgi:hypothetical protein